ncbi:hypothetical protein [Aestuariivirga sp.]|uniref:hypothetical protein n=1 Tax=Aestuariivirga sp. TaxID=2650926 RepID=UPI0039E262B3
MAARRTALFGAVTVLFTLLLALGLLEVLLRIDPSLMGVAQIDRMTPSLRSEIAARLGLSTKTTRPVLPSAGRFDHGPDIFLMEPNAVHVIRADAADLQLGAIEDHLMDAKGFYNPPGKSGREATDYIMAGDSFVCCVGVKADETSSAVLETLTGKQTYNLGIPGTGPYEYTEIVRRFGVPLHPKTVIFNIYEGNDLRDVMRFNDFRDGKVLKRKKEPMGGPFAVSYALAFIKASLENLAKGLSRKSGVTFTYTVTSQGMPIAMNVTNADGDEVRMAKRIVSGDVPPSLYGAPVRAFVELASASGFKPVCTYIPSAYTAYRGHVAFDDPANGAALEQASDMTREWLAGNVPQLGCAYLDLVPAFQAAASRGALTHFPANVHLTPYGHTTVAAAVAGFLAAQPGAN